MTYQVNDKQVELRVTARAFLLYENINDKSFQPQSLTDILTFVYCVITACSKDYTYTFEQFLDEMDEDPNKLNEIADWIKADIVANGVLKKKEPQAKKGRKSKSN